MSVKYALGPAARELKTTIEAGGYKPPAEMYDDPALSISAESMMAAIRPEMYEIGAVIGSDMTIAMRERMSAQFPPYGLISSRQGRVSKDGQRVLAPTPLTSVADYEELDAAFLRSSWYFIDNLYRLPECLEEPHERLKLLVQRAHQAHPKERRYESTGRFMWSGYNTATGLTIAALAGVSSLYKSSVETPGRGKYVSLAERSMCLVSPIAADNIQRIEYYRRAIQARLDGAKRPKDTVVVINPNILAFVPDLESAGAYVDYIKPPKRLIDPRTSQQVGAVAIPYPTLACLGTVKFPGVEIASRLVWDWVLEPFADLRYPKS